MSQIDNLTNKEVCPLSLRNKRHIFIVFLFLVAYPHSLYSQTYEEQYYEFKSKTQDNYNSFRDECNKAYIDFIKTSWNWYEGNAPIPMPKDELPIPPRPYHGENNLPNIDTNPIEIKSIENNRRHKPSNPTNSKPKDPNIVREWVEYNKSYPISRHTIFKDGKHVEINYRECTACHGSQKCNSCHGSGKCVSCHGSGRHPMFGTSCFFCNGTGLCSICEGAGNCSCTRRGDPYPGYSWARTKWIYADGTVEILTPEILEQNYRNGQHTNNNSNYYTNPNSNRRSSNELTVPVVMAPANVVNVQAEGSKFILVENFMNVIGAMVPADAS